MEAFETRYRERMNVKQLVFAACSLVASGRGGSASAAPEPEVAPAHIVLADLGLHVVGLGYQRTLGTRVALSVSVGLYDPWTVTDEVGDIRGAYVRARAYFFLVGRAPEGLWVSPFAQAAIVSGRRADGPALGGAAASGVALGYAFLIADHFHLGVGAGGQWHVADVSEDDAPPSFSELGWHIDLTLGYAF